MLLYKINPKHFPEFFILTENSSFEFFGIVKLLKQRGSNPLLSHFDKGEFTGLLHPCGRTTIWRRASF